MASISKSSAMLLSSTVLQKKKTTVSVDWKWQYTVYQVTDKYIA